MKAGDVITRDCIRSVRPGFGLAPKYFEGLLGLVLTKDVPMNTPVHGGCLRK
jgi:N-acetylneuraminate synthase